MADDMEQITRLIIPAPEETNRETGIQWYEVFLPPKDVKSPVRPRPSNPKDLPTLETRLSSEGSTTVMTAEGSEVRVEMYPAKEDGGVRIRAVVNDQEVVIYGDPADPASAVVTGSVDLGAAERKLVEQWARLESSFNALAQATRQSWGCGACALLASGVAVAAGCCVGGNPACCASALIGGGTTVENCSDNPCDLHPVVVQGGLAGT